MEDTDIVKNPAILELIDATFMQNVQDFLAKTLDIALVSTYETVWLTEPSNSCNFCKYIKRSKLGFRNCEDCHRVMEQKVKETRTPIIYECHARLKSFIVPVYAEGKYLACVIGGQILMQPPDENFFRELSKSYGIDENIFIEKLKTVRVISIEKFKAISDLLYLITNSVAGISQANTHLKTLGLDYKFPRNIVLENWFLNSYSNSKRILSSREHEVLKLIVLGKNNNEIAKELFISIHTVKVHVSSIIEKLGVEDRVQAAVKAVREDLL